MKILVSGTEKFIDLPSGWEWENDGEDLLTIFNAKDGVGALQISTYSQSDFSSLKPKSILQDFLENSKLSIQDHGDLNYSYCEFEINDSEFWRYWVIVNRQIVNRQKVILATYNCEIIDKTIEKELVDRMIGQLFL